MAAIRQRKLLAFKLDILKEQRSSVQTLTDQTDKVILLSDSWLENMDDASHVTYEELSQDIEELIAQLGDICISTSDCTSKIKTNQASVVTSSSQAVFSSTTDSQQTRECQFSDKGEKLETLVAEVKKMQEIISSLTNTVENMSQKQAIMEKSLDNLSAKYSQSVHAQVEDMQAELKMLTEKQKETATQQDKKLKNIESKIQTVTKEHSEMIEECQKEHRQEKKKSEKQSQKLSRSLSSLKENIQELNDQIILLETLNKKVEERDSELYDLTTNVNDSIKQLQQIKTEELQKVHEKITVMEVNYKELSEKADKLYSELKTKYEMVCQIVDGRLSPLERLRDIFSDKLDARMENTRKLNNISDQLDDLLPKINYLEEQFNRPVVGFTARVSSKCFIARDTIIRNFTNMIFNTGSHFDPCKGIFTAPVDGVYAAFLSGLQISKQVILLFIVKLPHSGWADDDDDSNDNFVARSGTNEFVGAGSIFAVVNLKQGERLCVKCKLVSKEAYLSEWTTFTCCRIG